MTQKPYLMSGPLRNPKIQDAFQILSFSKYTLVHNSYINQLWKSPYTTLVTDSSEPFELPLDVTGGL